jgi:aryl-alcohol dehydrogenase-like predicted oxidoreductase
VLADPRPDAPHGYGVVPAQLADRLRMFRAICERHAVPPRAVALQFPIAHPAVATVVVGARSPDEVADNIGLFSHPIPHAVWTDLKTAGLLAAGAPTP